MVLDHVEAYDVYGDFVFVGAATQNLRREELDVRPQRSPGLDDQRPGHRRSRTTASARPGAPPIDLEPATHELDHPAGDDPQQHHRRRAASTSSPTRAVAAPTEDISIIGNRFVGKAMTIRVNPPSGMRSRYRVIGNVSDTPVGFNGGGALAVHATWSASRSATTCSRCSEPGGISGVSITNSRNVVVIGNRFPYGKAPVFSRGGNFNVSQSGNFVGNPLSLAAGRRLPRPRLIRAGARDPERTGVRRRGRQGRDGAGGGRRGRALAGPVDPVPAAAATDAAARRRRCGRSPTRCAGPPTHRVRSSRCSAASGRRSSSPAGPGTAATAARSGPTTRSSWPACSKAFTAAVVLALVRAGRAAARRPGGAATCRAGTAASRVRQLLNHTQRAAVVGQQGRPAGLAARRARERRPDPPVHDGREPRAGADDAAARPARARRRTTRTRTRSSPGSSSRP